MVERECFEACFAPNGDAQKGRISRAGSEGQGVGESCVVEVGVAEDLCF